MSDTSTTPRQPRRPLVPGPNTSTPSISERAIATREATREATRVAPQQTKLPERQPEPAFPALVNPIPQRPMSVAGIAKGITGVMSEVGTIKKGGYNKFHQYHYARLEDLLEAITPLMGKHGIAVIQNEMDTRIIENRMAVTYEFSIIHSSGEVWPERPRFTGMTIGRDSKGNWDDKAINKCHSAARKYFLLSLFQVPSGDFDDPDPGQAPARTQTQERVPGPTGIQEAGDKAVKILKDVAKPPDTPQKIGLGPGKGADAWVTAYIACVEKAKTDQELRDWDTLNNDVLQNLNDNYPTIYDRVEVAVQARLAQLEQAAPPPTPEEMMPDPKVDTQEAMNWVAQKLAEMRTYQVAEIFWNRIVAPREKDFDEVDWGMLLGEWKRAELRLMPQDNPEAT